jgi:hypothetical protein
VKHQNPTTSDFTCGLFAKIWDTCFGVVASHRG